MLNRCYKISETNISIPVWMKEIFKEIREERIKHNPNEKCRNHSYKELIWIMMVYYKKSLKFKQIDFNRGKNKWQ